MTTSQFTKFAAFALCFFVLGSSFQLVLNTHFCGDKLKTWSLVGEAKKCSPQEMEEGCSVIHQEFSGDRVEKEPCCQDRKFVLGSETDSEEPTIFQAAQQYDVLGNLVTAVSQLGSLPTSKKIASARLYRPPALVHLIYLLHKVFRI